MAREADRNNDMTVAPERPAKTRPARQSPASASPTSLLDLAESVYENMPGFRPEIVGGQLVVNPPPDPRHAKSLTRLMRALEALEGKGVEVVQGLGLWLPTGDDDYVVPDLAVVYDDFEDQVVAFNCCAPHVFRMVVEITSTNHTNDTVDKPPAYASAGVPAYLIGDRKRREVVLLTDPRNGEYRSRAVYRPGETFLLPEAIGAKVELEADILLGSA